MLTLREAKLRASIFGARISWLNSTGEYRVTLDKWTGREARNGAYFTDDIDDALSTAIDMARRAA